MDISDFIRLSVDRHSCGGKWGWVSPTKVKEGYIGWIGPLHRVIYCRHEGCLRTLGIRSATLLHTEANMAELRQWSTKGRIGCYCPDHRTVN